MFIQSSRCCKADCINVSKLKLNLKTFHCPCLLSLTSKSCYIGGVVTFSRSKNSLDFLCCVSTFLYRTGRTFLWGVVSQKLCLKLRRYGLFPSFASCKKGNVVTKYLGGSVLVLVVPPYRFCN